MNTSILFEEKLTTEERNKLDDKDFGLQYERKYPLNDERHVLSAIQYFRFCNRSQRMELAKNINKKLKYFDMKVNVDVDNPFFNYIDKKYLVECATLSLINFDDICPQKMYDEIRTSKPSSYDDIMKIEKRFIGFYNKLSCMTTTDVLLKFVKSCNIMIESMYDQFLNYKIYNGEEDKNTIMYSVCEDLINLCCKKYEYDACGLDDFNKDLTAISKIGYFQPFNFIINRKLLYVILSSKDLTKTEVKNKKYNAIKDVRRKLLKDTFNSNEYRLNDLFLNVINEYRHLPMTEMYLENTRNEAEKEIYIINKNMNSASNKFAIPYTEISNSEQKEIINTLENNNINSQLLIDHFPNYTTELSDLDILYLFKNTDIKNVSMGHFKNEICWYAVDHEKVFYVFKSNDGERFVLVEIDHNILLNLINSLHIDIDVIDNNTQYITINKNVKLIEGININKDGDIKIIIDKKKSYMDLYSEIHRTLHMEYKNKNLEGMKSNVALMFALINTIEHDKKFKKQDPSLIKARAFAMNDFKTYLNHIYEAEPDFVFIDYYRNTDLGKKVFNIPSESIVGIKKLFRTILMP